MNRSYTVNCPYCPLSATAQIEDHQTGDVICAGCGLVLGDRIIEESPEWRCFSSNNQVNSSSFTSASSNISRVGASFDVHSSSYLKLATKIGALPLTERKVTSVDASLDKINNDANQITTSSNFSTYKKPKTETSGVFCKRVYLSSDEKLLISGLSDIAEMGAKSNATEPIVATAQAIFKEIHMNSSILRYRGNLCAACAACLFFAYRKHKVPRTLKELCAVAHTSVRDIGKMFTHIKQKVWSLGKNYELGNGHNDHQNHQQTMVVDLLPRFLAALDLPRKVHGRAVSIVNNIEQRGHLLGRNPTTIAALAIFMALLVEGFHIIDKKISPEKSLVQTQSITSEYSEHITSSTSNNIGANIFKNPFAAKCLSRIAEVSGAAETTIREVFFVLQAKAGDEFVFGSKISKNC